MKDRELAPLTVSCPSCWMPAEDFDIIRQEYRCRYCGGSLSARDARVKFETWAQEHAFETAKGVAQLDAGGRFACPNCGAEAHLSTFALSDELASTKCEYCGTQLVAAPPGKTFTSPDVMIPFFITLDEAKDRLREWCAKHPKRPEARMALAHIDEMRGAYLPYEVVKGPIRFTVSRDSSERVYTCGGYLDGTAVSTSRFQHNLTLDAMEPFDWGGARAYDHGYTAGQTVKLRDIDEERADKRVAEEISAAYLPRVERTMMTRGIDVDEIPGGDRIRASALLPAYLLNLTLGTGDAEKLIHVAVNGQTGRVAVQSAKDREIGRYWFLMPTAITAAAAAIVWFFARDWEVVGMISLVFGMIMFAMFHEYGIKRHTREVVMSGESVRAKRSGRELVFESGDTLPPATAPPVFFESIRGAETPVDLKFFGKARTARTVIQAGIIAFLPSVITAIFALRAGVPFSQVQWGYGAPWFTITFAVVPVYLMRYGFNWVFDSPIVREIMPDGSRRKVPDADVDAGVKSGTSFSSNFRASVRQSKGVGCFLIGLPIFLLLGSVGVTVSKFPTPEELSSAQQIQSEPEPPAQQSPSEPEAPAQQPQSEPVPSAPQSQSEPEPHAQQSPSEPEPPAQPAQQRRSAAEAFLGYVPDFASEPVRAAYDRFFGSPEWGAGDHDGRSIVSFMGVVNYRGEDRPVLMIFDVTEYARGGEMKMELATMAFRDTKEIISGALAERIMRAPFEKRE